MQHGVCGVKTNQISVKCKIAFNELTLWTCIQVQYYGLPLMGPLLCSRLCRVQ